MLQQAQQSSPSHAASLMPRVPPARRAISSALITIASSVGFIAGIVAASAVELTASATAESVLGELVEVSASVSTCIARSTRPSPKCHSPQLSSRSASVE
eukprot:3377949-Prymnesium_polylepis.1